jgi:Beta-galactosidase/beta-glucuronidase
MNHNSIPRSEYPRPQFVRPDWLCLNGEWEFEADPGDSGKERGLLENPLSGRITVPFCPESDLSGVGHKDYMNVVWYRRVVEIPAEWAGKSRILLHFQAVDQDATVWANGVEVGRHRGGFTPFTCELTGIAAPGESVTLVVRARDFHHIPQARGKQANRYAPYSCLYTRTTGIWQTVWMEPVAEVAFGRPRITPDVANSRFDVVTPLSAGGPGPNRDGWRVRATLTDAEGDVVTAETRADYDLAPRLTLDIPEGRRRLWSPEDPHLYGLTLELLDASGAVVDRAESYAGLRSVSLEGRRVKLNGKSVFQRLILDQGYWPESVMTAPTDDELKADIERAQAAGFNGARLHQKVFEERFLYWADKLGYLVWGEFGDWGCGGFGPSHDHQKPDASYVAQWLEAVERDYSHPSIVGWCPLNETWQVLTDRITVLDDVTRAMFLATKAADPTRPVLDASGYAHRVAETDIYDSHDYDQKPETFAERHAHVAENKPYRNLHDNREESLPYRGQPYFVSEFGGIWWNPAAFDNKESWGYGERVKSLDEFYARFEGLCKVLLDNPEMFGYCYTQLTDVYPEENGIYTFDRKPKFDNARLKAVQSRKAAIEES